jgi:hypothetical protein
MLGTAAVLPFFNATALAAAWNVRRGATMKFA